MGAMMTLGDLRAATAGMEDDLCLTFALDVLGKTLGCHVESAERVDDPFLGFDEVVFGMSVDPDEIADDDVLMAQLNERGELLRDYYDSICEWRAAPQGRPAPRPREVLPGGMPPGRT